VDSELGELLRTDTVCLAWAIVHDEAERVELRGSEAMVKMVLVSNTYAIVSAIETVSRCSWAR
jgi:hypothetical protein